MDYVLLSNTNMDEKSESSKEAAKQETEKESCMYLYSAINEIDVLSVQ